MQALGSWHSSRKAKYLVLKWFVGLMGWVLGFVGLLLGWVLVYGLCRDTPAEKQYNRQPGCATYSSPILRTSKSPQPWPMSDSWISSVRFTMVAPTALGVWLVVECLCSGKCES